MARPFGTTIDSLTLGWHDESGSHTRAFADPTIGPSPDPGQQPHFLVHAGDRLSRDEVQELYHALAQPAANTQLAISLSYGYWIDSSSNPQPPRDPPTHHGWPWFHGGTIKPIIVGPASMHLSPAAAPHVASAAPRVAVSTLATSALLPLHTLAPGAGSPGAGSPPAAGGASTPAPVGTPAGRGGPMVTLSTERIDTASISEILKRRHELYDQHDFHRVSYTRTVPFSFDEALEANAPIYRAIKGDQLTTDWTSTPNGWLRRAEYVNTVYRLPDEVRLAFNVDLGVPHVLPTLYRDDQGDAKVRVVMRLEAWHDPDALVAVCDDLGTAPDIVVGGYDSATLSFTGAFPDQIHALSGSAVPVTLETGAEVTLDLTVEFYTFLCQLLTGPIGVTGSVAVTLGQTKPTDGSPAQPIVRQVPVRLALASPASLPLDVSVPDDAVSPGQVSLQNTSGAPVTVGGCEPRLLQYDQNSVVPLEVLKGKTTSGVPVSLAAGTSSTIDVAPVDASGARLWNAVLAQLTDIRLDLDPNASLARIYEVAPVGTLDWQLDIESPPLSIVPPPAKFAAVIAIDVQVNRSDGGHDIVHLTRTAATAKLTMHRTLEELTAGSGDIGTFTFAVRNFYDDHVGQWSDPQPGEGSNLTVYPNDPGGD